MSLLTYAGGRVFIVLFCFDFFLVFFSTAAGSIGDEGDSIFPKAGLGYANNCLDCICGKTLSNSTAALYFLIAM